MKLQTKTGKLVPVDSRQDPETRKRQQVAQAALDLLELRVREKKLKEEIDGAKSRLEELTGLTRDIKSEDARPFVIPGAGQVIRVYSAGAARIDRERLVGFLMSKLGATGEQAKQIADAATVQTPYSYIDFKPEKAEKAEKKGE